MLVENQSNQWSLYRIFGKEGPSYRLDCGRIRLSLFSKQSNTHTGEIENSILKRTLYYNRNHFVQLLSQTDFVDLSEKEPTEIDQKVDEFFNLSYRRLVTETLETIGLDEKKEAVTFQAERIERFVCKHWATLNSKKNKQTHFPTGQFLLPRPIRLVHQDNQIKVLALFTPEETQERLIRGGGKRITQSVEWISGQLYACGQTLETKEAYSSFTKELEVYESLKAKPYIASPPFDVKKEKKTFAWVYTYLQEWYPNTLSSLIDQGNLSPSQRFELSHSLIHMLDFLSEDRVLHGEIKPENILLDHETQPKLIDFPFVQRLDHSFEWKPAVLAEGTIGCIPPENYYCKMMLDEGLSNSSEASLSPSSDVVFDPKDYYRKHRDKANTFAVGFCILKIYEIEKQEPKMEWSFEKFLSPNSTHLQKYYEEVEKQLCQYVDSIFKSRSEEPHSFFMQEIIKRMLIPDPENRVNSKQLLTSFQSHLKKISKVRRRKKSPLEKSSSLGDTSPSTDRKKPSYTPTQSLPRMPSKTIF